MGNRVLQDNIGRKFVITINAMDYVPDAEGKSDCTEKLQQAIEDCKALGGGTVFLPTGRYALHGTLTIRRSVMLHGDGAVLECYYGRGSGQGMQICMEACSGLLDVVLFYPEQNMEEPVPYPPTVRQQGSNSITVENVTFVNPWIGIQCGPDANELHYIKNVRMSPLYQGIFMDMTTDIGRMQEVSVSPSWYREFIRKRLGEGKAVQTLSDACTAFMQTHATGIYMARSDWEYGYHIVLEGLKVGLLVTSGQDIGPNAQLSALTIRDCEVGIQLHRGNPYGIAITDSLIVAGKETRKAAIQCDETFTTVLQCYGLTIEGHFDHLVCQEGKAQLSFAECHFTGKGRTEDILQKAGGLSLLNSYFSPGGVHVKVSEGAGGAQLVGCLIKGKQQEIITVACQDGAENKILREDARVSFPIKRSCGHVPYPYPAEPERDDLYPVTKFGARGDGVRDDTDAFEEALAYAGITGGYVYVPGGKYRITRSLTIPKGVELRGIAEVPCHTMGGGSVLMVCCGKGEEEGEPFVSLEGDCGIRGVVFYHPWQDPVTPHPYPWTVRSLGDRCYCVDTVFVNAWKGIDFGSVGGRDHYISYVSGAPIRCGIFAGRNTGGMWVENVQYNPHYWYRCELPGRPDEDTWKEFWHNQIRYLDAFVYGDIASLHVLNTFVFAARNGVRFIRQEGKGTKGVLIGHGTDGGECGILIEGLEDVEFVNTELVTIESPNRRIYLRNAGKGGTFYNTLMWGAPHTAVLMEGGDLKMLLTNVVDSGERAVEVEAGEADIVGSFFYRKERQLLVRGGKVRYLANMAAKTSGKDKGILSPEVEKAGGVLEEAFNWYM